MLLTECSPQEAQPCDAADARLERFDPPKIIGARPGPIHQLVGNPIFHAYRTENAVRPDGKSDNSVTFLELRT